MYVCGVCGDPVDTRGNGPIVMVLPGGAVSMVVHQECGQAEGMEETWKG